MLNEHKLRMAEDAVPATLPTRPRGRPPGRPAKTTGNKPTKVLPTVRIAFGKQLDILRAFAAASGAENRLVNLRQVSDIVKMASGTVTLANPFFVDVKLLSRSEGMGLTPSPSVMEFGRAYEWNRETAAHKLAPVLSRTWFAEALLPRLAFDDITEEEAIAVLAEKSSSPPDYRNQLRLLLDYMEAANLVKRDNGHVRATRTSGSSAAAIQATSVEHHQSPEERPKTPSAGKVATAFVEPTQGVVNFHIDVRMNMTEFSGWEADRITAFFGGIAQVLNAKARIEQEASDEKE